ncbi:transcriptional regulator [Kitasatospora sp. NPDC088160]|uniref:transcriptional regulator n=1 Tax=Kitasatospora sp. NPDC088160 TaxID=3364072 RepID=UPI00380ECEA4
MEIDQHPLTYLLHQNNWTATQYLARLSTVHERLGYGAIPPDRKRITRWTRHGTTPEPSAQKAMAVLHNIPQSEVADRPWPAWLSLACMGPRDLLHARWTPQAAIELLDHAAAVGGLMDRQGMDRRGFVIVAGLAPVLAQAATAPLAPARTTGSRIGASVPALFEQSLAILRRQDDQFGSGQVHASARAQLALITKQLKTASYTEATGRRLYAAAAEAARICAWTAYDSGQHALAEEHYLVALRAAASSGDPVVTANTLAFWAIMRYSTADANGAVDLVNGALGNTRQIGSARMEAMLLARLARAHAHAGDSQAAAHAQNAAMAAYDRARDQDTAADPDCVYWLNLGEIRMLQGSCSLNLGRPKEAISHFEDASAGLSTADTYREDEYPRGAAIYLAREAEARIALDDLDGAIDTAHRAVDHMGGITSARSTSTLADLRSKFTARREVPIVREFLESTAYVGAA